MTFDAPALVGAALAVDPYGSPAPLTALARVAALRQALDEAEHDLIAEARRNGNSWATVAERLGLRSRQAAEQRYLRLNAVAGRDPGPVRANRQRQRSVDTLAGPVMADLRAAVSRAARVLRADRSWRHDHARADLIRSTVDSAVEATPGALYALVQKVVDDIATDPGARPSAPVTAALDALRDAWIATYPDRTS